MNEFSTAAHSKWQALLRGLCPRCRRGAIFQGALFWRFPHMYERCPVCDLRLEREQGYFLGAMMIGYALAVPVMGAFLALFWALTDWSWEKLLLVSFLALLPFAPGLTLFARVLWIHFDRAVDPEKQ